MRQAFATGLLGCALLLSGAVADAQVYGRGYYDGGRVYGEYRRHDPGRDLFDRVWRDVERAESYSYRYGDGGDRRRFNKLREELREFQDKWARGRFDRHELDDVIGALQRVLNDNRLDDRQRDALQEDIYELRDFRASR